MYLYVENISKQRRRYVNNCLFSIKLCYYFRWYRASVMKKVICAVLILCMVQGRANAEQFVSLKSSKINMRVGPGDEFPISWVFLRAGLPMMLIAEFQQWRKVRYLDNTEGWMHRNMISGKNTAVVTKEGALLYKKDSESCPIAKIEKNVIVKVLEKRDNWIRVDINKIKGWIPRDNLWGIDDDVA